MGAPSNSKCGQAEHGMSDGNMESTWAQNISHLPKLMWRPEVSLLACKIFRALDSASIGPAKIIEIPTVQLHFFALGSAEILRMVQCRTRAKRSGPKGSPCWTPDADIN